MNTDTCGITIAEEGSLRSVGTIKEFTVGGRTAAVQIIFHHAGTYSCTLYTVLSRKTGPNILYT